MRTKQRGCESKEYLYAWEKLHMGAEKDKLKMDKINLILDQNC
jgi:hypothetical protein